MSATNEEHPAGEANNEQTDEQTDEQTNQHRAPVTGEDAGPQGAPGEQAAQDTEKTQPTEEKPAEAEAPEDLFDLMGESGKQHKKKKPEPAKTASASGAQSQPKEEKKYPANAEVAYAGHKIELPREMTAAEIVAFLEDDFPELTKDSTEFTHDQARNRIVPTRKALKKGASGVREGVFERAFPRHVGNEEGRENRTLEVHTLPVRHSPPPVYRVLASDGVYEVRNTALGTFTARVPAQADINEGVCLKLPKAPVSLLEKTVAIFAARPDREALVTIVYDHRDGAHHLVWVDQAATATSIDYDPVPENEHITVYCEIHSHNLMDAFFSRTDDGSEARSGGLYGVIGRVDLDRPHAAFRYSCGRHFRRLRATSLFDDPARVGELVAEHPV